MSAEEGNGVDSNSNDNNLFLSIDKNSYIYNIEMGANKL